MLESKISPDIDFSIGYEDRGFSPPVERETSNYEMTRQQLELQDAIRGRNLNINGGVPDYLFNIFEQSNTELTSILETEEGKRNHDRIYELTHNLNIPEKKMEESFIDGLRYNIKAAIKIGFFDTGIDTKELIGEIIGSYTLSFRQTLRSFDKKREDHQDDCNLILTIAKKSYLLDPNIYRDLSFQYKDEEFITSGMIKRAILNYPTNPGLFLEKTKANCAELIKQYEGNDFISSANIKYAVIHSSRNPKAYIERIITNCSILSKKYQGDEFVTPGMIKHVAVNFPTDPESFIEKARTTYARLEEKYQEYKILTPSDIKYIVIYFPTDPESFIKKINTVYPKLQKEYPHIPREEIIRALTCYSNNYRKYLDSWK